MKKNRYIFLVLIFAACFQLISESSVEIEQKIVNGTATTLSDWNDKFSGVVGIIAYLGDGDGYMCTGTLIAPNVVLTAGHCVFSKDENGKVIFNGISNPGILSIHDGLNLSYYDKTASVTKAVTHESWSGDLGGTDIAMLLLNKNITNLLMYNQNRSILT